MNYDWGPADRGKPALSWNVNEPSFFVEDGWGRVPATMETEFVFSTALTGTECDGFDGQVFLSIDSEPQSFKFSDGIVTSSISNLKFGPHNLYLLAASVKGEAGYSREFDVLSEPPGMQVGIGLDDGFLHIDLERPIPSSQLSDLSKWKINGFNSEKSDVKVQTGNDSVVIELVNSIGRIEDIDSSPNTPSPEVSFDSSLGVMQAQLYDIDRDGGRAVEVVGCEKGGVYPLGTCNPASGWTINLQHLESVGREAREVLNSEKVMQFPGDCWYFGDEPPWRNCTTWTVVAYNWFLEGHLNPAAPANWNAQYDTVVYSTTSGYEGVGYSNGHWEHYDRSKGFFPPSLCAGLNTQWEVRVDCSNCDENDPSGYESKGWNMDAELEADSTCPEFTEIQAMPGVELNDYVEDQLIPELSAMGIAYTASGVTGESNMFDYYWLRCGRFMDEWNQNNPGGLVFVVQARDVDSPQGKWIQNMLSIDYEDENGNRYFLEDEQLQFFYVDMDEPYDQELSGENWPHRTTCNEPLQTDAQKQGEYCCWIIKAGCGFLNWNSCRFRIKDDCNNWTRSENLVPGGNVTVEITEPLDESEHEWGTPVFCHANVVGNPSYDDLGNYIKWSVRPSGGTNWYGPNEPWEYSDWTEVIDSYISDTVWIGQNFYIDSFEDCLGLEIKARLDVCGFSLDDTCTIYIPGVRSGQTLHDWELHEIGVLVDDRYNVGSGDMLLLTSKNICANAPILERTNGTCTIDYIVQVVVPNDCVSPPPYVETTVSSPSDEDSDEIDVWLYPIDPESTRHSDLEALFNEFGSSYDGIAYYYARGSDIFGGYNAIELNVSDKNIIGQDRSQDSHERNVEPRLYVNDDDNFGEVKDYSIAISEDPKTIQKNYSDLLFRMYYGTPSETKRGLYNEICNINDGVIKNKYQNVLVYGSEYIKFTAEGISTYCAVQSRGEAFFIIGHGKSIEPYAEPRRPDYSTTVEFEDDHIEWVNKCVVDSIGPFDGLYVNRVFWASCELQTECEWFISNACKLLSDASAVEWYRDLIGSGYITAICGFGDDVISGSWEDIPDFWSDFSSGLTSGNSIPNPLRWEIGHYSSNPAVIAWMENAYLYCGKCLLPEKPVIDARAICGGHIYYIKCFPPSSPKKFVYDFCGYPADYSFIISSKLVIW